MTVPAPPDGSSNSVNVTATGLSRSASQSPLLKYESYRSRMLFTRFLHLRYRDHRSRRRLNSSTCLEKPYEKTAAHLLPVSPRSEPVPRVTGLPRRHSETPLDIYRSTLAC